MKNRNRILAYAITAGTLASIFSCANTSKIERIRHSRLSANLHLPEQNTELEDLTLKEPIQDTLQIEGFDGRKVMIMKAVRDADGEMVATDVIRAATVTARFRNVVERRGKVSIEFQIIVPKDMQDKSWQLRFFPTMYILQDSVKLDSVMITGEDYRKAQLRGYDYYNNFLSKIINDDRRFIDIRQLEIFIERNIPALYALKNDSSFVDRNRFESIYGVREKEAVEHYTNKFAKFLNERRKAKKEKMYRKYVKVPIERDGLRLDTVITNVQGDFVFNYIHTFETRPNLRKVHITIDGKIYESNSLLYTMPKSDTLTFYISSLSTFAQDRTKYLTKVIERRAEANADYNIRFRIASSDIDTSEADNNTEIELIKTNLRHLIRNEEYDLDSIVVSATSSPEGSVKYNSSLSESRSRAVSEFFNRYMEKINDSIKAEAGMSIDIDGRIAEKKNETIPIRFISKAKAENWEDLARLFAGSSLFNDKDKRIFIEYMNIPDEDKREAGLKTEGFYQTMKDSLYPSLRKVKFAFFLHRKGMVKDTIHTTIIDSVYMQGVQALKDHDYRKAVALLRPYEDYNTAVAFTACDYNASAIEILERLDKTAEVNYMIALISSRQGNYQKAVEMYLKSCKQNPAYIHRGKLDPEISILIDNYKLSSGEY